MTEYHEVGVTLTKDQIKKLVKTRKSEGDVTIRIKKDNLTGQMKLPLTQTQMNALIKAKSAKSANTGVQLKLSKAQLNYMEKTGGFLPLLAFIAGAVGAAGAATGGIASAVSAAKSNAEQARHNREIEKMNREALKTGEGMLSDIFEPIPVVGIKLSSALKKLV